MATDRPMQLGMVGLGRMGANLTRRLMRDGHEMVAHDVSPDAVARLASEGATGANSLDELVRALAKPRAVWVMVPAGEITEKTVSALADLLDEDDVIILEVRRVSRAVTKLPQRAGATSACSSAWATVRVPSRDSTTRTRSGCFRKESLRVSKL